MPDRYLVCGCTPWARRAYDKTISKFPGEWRYVDDPALVYQVAWNPRYIFFLHWRWKVPKGIVEKYECVGMHLGWLPLQRGGSPLQWRILEGATHATLTAFRMTALLDVGPHYATREVPLYGSAEAIYAVAMQEAANIIGYIIDMQPTPTPPLNDWTRFRPLPRRTPEESRLPADASLEKVYDWMRCVDAEGYPRAFLEYGGLRFEFERAVMYDGRIKADVVITELEVEG